MQSVARRTDVRRPSRSHRGLRLQIAAAYERTYDRTVRRDTIEGLEALVGWLLRCQRAEGPVFRRTMGQVFRGCGWPTTGRIRADRQAHRRRAANWFDMLVEMGWLDSWEALYEPNGEGKCLELRCADALNQLSYLAARRSVQPRGRSFSSSRVSPPLREKVPSSALLGSFSSREKAVARERAREAGRAGHRATAAAIAALERASEDGGAEALTVAPWLAELRVTVLMRAATATFAVRRGCGWARHFHTERGLRISPTAARIAETAAAQLDRLDGPGAGAAAIVELAAGGHRRHVPPGTRFPEPRTAGALAYALRREARQRAAVRRRGGGLEPVDQPPALVEDLAWS